MKAERRGGWHLEKVSDQEIQDKLDAGIDTAAGVARAFRNEGIEITQQAISARLRKMREDKDERAGRVLPWAVRSPDHSTGWVFLAARAYATWQKGGGLDPRELKLAKELDGYLRQHDAVLTYDRSRGFLMRNRRPDDGPSGLATA